MQISDIQPNDAKYLMQVKNLLKLVVTDMKFSLGEAKTVNETVNWFDGFMEVCGNVQKFENEEDAKKKTGTEKTEGLASLKIKDMHPGDFSKPRAGTKAKARAKSKNKPKRKK